MKLLEERIAREGKVLPGNVVKVDGFLNHRVDAAFLGKLADEFIAHFDINGLTAVMTVEASGIPLATVCAEKMGVPMIFAKKAKSDNIEGGLFKSEIMSYTYKKKVTLIVSAEWLHHFPGERQNYINQYLLHAAHRRRPGSLFQPQYRCRQVPHRPVQ